MAVKETRQAHVHRIDPYRRGLSVILLEHGLVGQQASGTNFGNVRRQGRFSRCLRTRVESVGGADGLTNVSEVATTPFPGGVLKGSPRFFQANEDHCRALVTNSIGIITALNPFIGYHNATRIAKKALESGRGVTELVLEKGLLTTAELDDILAPENMTRPRRIEPRGALEA